MFSINAAIRDYFNHRYDDASFRLELAKLHGLRDPRPRDFRSRRERLRERLEDEQIAARSVSPKPPAPNA